MSATGLDVFDKTLQTTNIWLDEIMAKLGRTDRWRGMCWAPSCTRCAIAFRSDWRSISARNCRSSYGVSITINGTRASRRSNNARRNSSWTTCRSVSRAYAGQRQGRHACDAPGSQPSPRSASSREVRQALPENIRALWRRGQRGNASTRRLKRLGDAGLSRSRAG